MNIVLFGPPGAGKGTQAKLICEKYNLLHISTGDILRAEIKSGSDLGNNVKNLIETGQLVSDNIIIEMIQSYIDKSNNNFVGFLFDGFPRTLKQADLLSIFIESLNLKLSAAILLDVQQTSLIARVLNRKETEGRSDDNEKILASRLKIFYEETAPLIDHYKELNLLKWIDGIGEINEVNQRISSIIGEL